MKTFGLVALFFFLVVLITTIYGLYLAFSASIILGVIVLIVEPLPLILGIIGAFGHPEVARRIAEWLGM